MSSSRSCLALSCAISALTLAACGDSTAAGTDGPAAQQDGSAEHADAPLADSALRDDGGAPRDGAAQTDGPTDYAPACAVFDTAPGRRLTVTYDGQTIDFSTGIFDAAYNDDPVAAEHYWYFNFRSADNGYGLEVQIPPAYSIACPTDFALPDTSMLMRAYFYRRTDTGGSIDYTTLAGSEYPGSSGTLTIDAYQLETTDLEIAFRCTDCVFGPPPGATTPAVHVSGDARQKL
ncbi:MAG TPA: hypothetical protein VGQ83_21265 [Polyangia bacterium]|jgi:hypothetical protein